MVFQGHLGGTGGYSGAGWFR